MQGAVALLATYVDLVVLGEVDCLGIKDNLVIMPRPLGGALSDDAV